MNRTLSQTDFFECFDFGTFYETLILWNIIRLNIKAEYQIHSFLMLKTISTYFLKVLIKCFKNRDMPYGHFLNREIK